jgi:hypothetical protein
MDDGYAVFEQELRSIDARFQELLRDDEVSVTQELGELLAAHSQREEAALHPLLRRYVDGGDDLADRAVTEHAAIAAMVAELSSSSAALDTPALADLGNAIAAHVEFVQGEVIPEMQSCGVDGARVAQQLEGPPS